MTFGDGVSDVDLGRLVEFHVRMAPRDPDRGAAAGTLRPRRPRRRQVAEFSEKPQTGEGWINGGYMVLDRKVLDYIDSDDVYFQKEPMERLAARRPADGVSPRLLLAMHGHASRQGLPGEPLGERRGSLEGVGLMRLLVTGSEGYIGTVLCAYLIAHGHDVTGLDTGFHRVGWLYNGVDRSPSWIAKDVRSITVDDLRGYDAVVHLAELSNDPVGQLNPDITFEINHLGSVRLATLAREAGVERFIYMSSCSVYGAAGSTDSTETSECRPADRLRQVQGPRRARRPAARRRRLLADVPAQRDRVRRLAAACASTSSSTTSPATPGPSR